MPSRDPIGIMRLLTVYLNVYSESFGRSSFCSTYRFDALVKEKFVAFFSEFFFSLHYPLLVSWKAALITFVFGIRTKGVVRL